MQDKRCCWRLICQLATLLILAAFVLGCGSTGVSGGGAQGTTSFSANQLSVQFGNVPVGTSATQVLTFTNSSGSSSSVTVSSVQVSGAGFSLTQQPTLPLVVAPGQSASITVQALPSAAGALTGTITVTSNASPSTITINLSATGITTTGTTFSVAGQLTPASLVLGATVTLSGTGSPSTQTVDSNGNFTFLGVTTGTYTITPAEASTTFAPASQQVTVGSANVTGISFAVTFSISGSLGASGSGATVTLAGPVSATVTAGASGSFSFTGLPNGNYTITPTKPGVIFTPASQPVTINNASISGSTLNFTESFTISGIITPVSVGAGATVSLTGTASQQVTADANGNFVLSGVPNGTYTVTPTHGSATFVPANQSVTISSSSVTGITFAANGQLTINPSSFTFTPVSVGTASQPQSATLSAAGGDVTITSDTLTGSGFGFSGIPFPFTIPSGQSAPPFTVTFTPGSAGSSSGTLSFNSGSTALATANLSGAGVGLSVSSSALSFGAVLDGTSSATQVVTLTAVGAAVTVNSANLVQNGGGGSAFSITNMPALPFPIAAGATAQFDVSFAPASGSPGAAAGTLTLGTSANSPTETLSGTGQSNVLLTWTASTSPNVTYNVYRCSISASACVQGQPGNFAIVATGISPLTYTDSTVSSGQTYYYALTAVDSSFNEGSLSAVSAGAAIP